MPTEPALRRYVSLEEDSARWDAVEFRDGDIVISTRSKSGTTWVQMICALLIFRQPDLPARLIELSPWVDHLVEPVEEVVARLAAQPHRRFIKTHTPLDGVPFDRRVFYVVVARNPVDAAVSLYHQGDNLDRRRISELVGSEFGEREPRPMGEWLDEWLESDDALGRPDCLAGHVAHAAFAWRRRDEPNVRLVHYADLLADLPGEMAALAAWLGIDITQTEVAGLAESAGFEAMRARSDELAPDAAGIMLDRRAFFRSGGSGSGVAVLAADQKDRYRARLAQLASPELVAWLVR